MRIVVSCLQSRHRYPIPAYDFWRTYFVRGLEEAGHDVLEVPDIDWAIGLVHHETEQLNEWRERTWESVLLFVRSEQQRRPVDLFLGYLHPRQIETAAIEALQADSIPCVNFFCDNVREFRSVPAEFRPFALHWVPEFEALPMYRGAALPHIHAPMPCWVPQNLRGVATDETEPPTFIGSADILRRDLLGRAVQAGAALKARGAGWSDVGDGPARESRRGWPAQLIDQTAVVRKHGLGALVGKLESRVRPLRPLPLPACSVGPAPLRHDEYFDLIRKATVCLGINRVPTARRSHRNPLRYSRLRDIEAPMLGACYLTEWTEGVECLFEPGAEIETYRTAEELSAKLHELGADRARRRAMRERAQRRALSDYSVARSVARIGERIGLPP